MGIFFSFFTFFSCLTSTHHFSFPHFLVFSLWSSRLGYPVVLTLGKWTCESFDGLSTTGGKQRENEKCQVYRGYVGKRCLCNILRSQKCMCLVCERSCAPIPTENDRDDQMFVVYMCFK